MTQEPLFETTHQALRFAFLFSDQQYDPPAMNKMMRGGMIGSGKGLVGLDGAAQAGLIKAEVIALDMASQMVITARFSPRQIECDCGKSCCSGHKPSMEHREAIVWLIDYVLRQGLCGSSSHYRIRQDLVARIYGEKRKIEEIAKEHDKNRDTIGAYASRVSKHLQAVEQRAMETLDERFRDYGLVGCSAAA